jgi:plasmid stability protein
LNSLGESLRERSLDELRLAYLRGGTTLVCVRTTIQLDDEVFRAFKQRAAEHGTSLAHEIEEALRSELAARVETAQAGPYRVPTFRGAAPVPGVDLNSNAALADILDRTG